MSTPDDELNSLFGDHNSVHQDNSVHLNTDQEIDEFLDPLPINELDFAQLKDEVNTLAGDMLEVKTDTSDLRANMSRLLDDIAHIKRFILEQTKEHKPDPATTNNVKPPISERLSVPNNLKANRPKPFSGIRSETEDFIFQCDANFESCNGPVSAKHKQNFFASYLVGDALKWFQNTVRKGQVEFVSYEAFLEVFKGAFGIDEVITEECAVTSISTLTQTGSCSTYSNQFVKYSSHTQHNEYSKMQLYKLGLKPEVRHHLNHSPPAKTLADLMRQCILFDDREFALTARRRPTPYQRPEPVASTRVAAADVIRDSSSTSLTNDERKRRRDNHLCPYCGEAACPGVKDVKTCSVLLAKNGKSTKGYGARA
jgi:hypothetical protein